MKVPGSDLLEVINIVFIIYVCVFILHFQAKTAKSIYLYQNHNSVSTKKSIQNNAQAVLFTYIYVKVR